MMTMPKPPLAIGARSSPARIDDLPRPSTACAQSITVLFYLFPNAELPSGSAPSTGGDVLAPCGTASDHNAISLRFLAGLLGTDAPALSRALQLHDRDAFVQLQWRLAGYVWPVNTTLHRVDAACAAADVSFTGTLALQTGMAAHLAACRFPGQDMAWPGPAAAAAVAVGPPPMVEAGGVSRDAGCAGPLRNVLSRRGAGRSRTPARLISKTRKR